MLSPRGARGVEKAELNGNVDSDYNHGGSLRTYVLHRIGCTQEDDQLLRQGCEWSSSPGRQAWGNAPRAGHLDESASAALDCGHGSDHLHRLALRSSEGARSGSEGRASADVAGDRRIQEEERSDRCRQARGLSTLRLSAGVLHGLDPDSREAANA